MNKERSACVRIERHAQIML